MARDGANDTSAGHLVNAKSHVAWDGGKGRNGTIIALTANALHSGETSCGAKSTIVTRYWDVRAKWTVVASWASDTSRVSACAVETCRTSLNLSTRQD